MVHQSAGRGGVDDDNQAGTANKHKHRVSHCSQTAHAPSHTSTPHIVKEEDTTEMTEGDAQQEVWINRVKDSAESIIAAWEDMQIRVRGRITTPDERAWLTEFSANMTALTDHIRSAALLPQAPPAFKAPHWPDPPISTHLHPLVTMGMALIKLPHLYEQVDTIRTCVNTFMESGSASGGEASVVISDGPYQSDKSTGRCQLRFNAAAMAMEQQAEGGHLRVLAEAHSHVRAQVAALLEAGTSLTETAVVSHNVLYNASIDKELPRQPLHTDADTRGPQAYVAIWAVDDDVVVHAAPYSHKITRAYAAAVPDPGVGPIARSEAAIPLSTSHVHPVSIPSGHVLVMDGALVHAEDQAPPQSKPRIRVHWYLTGEPKHEGAAQLFYLACALSGKIYVRPST